MKNILKAVICIFILILVPCAVSAEGLYTYGDGAVKETRINMQTINGENVIVLPSAVSSDKVCLYGDFPAEADVYAGGEKFSSGMEITLGGFSFDNGYVIPFSDKNGIVPDFTVKILFSENVPAVYIVSDNPVENGREWIEASLDKSNKSTGFMVMQECAGSFSYKNTFTQLKGRGNSTWVQAKKPYQVKLPERVDLLGTGNDENKSKTWLLLANYLDPSLLNNSIVLGMGKELGMKANVESTHVDLYYDGEYRGSYLLAEKVEVGSGRVDVADMEEKNSALNGDGEFPISTAVTANGAEYTYCDGMISPEDITGGYLLEMDYEVRAKEEVCYFRTTRNQYVVVKSPEFASKEEMDYIATLYQEYEDAVFGGGVNPTTGKAYSDYVDRESIAVYYLLNEFSKARDFFGSSAYLYKNAGEDKLYMGPLWDYDLGFTEGRFDSDGEETPYGLSIYNTDLGAKLSEIPDFSALLQEMYSDKLLPLINRGIEADFRQKSEEIASSASINSMLWHNNENYGENAESLFSFMKKRVHYLEGAFASFTEIDHSQKPFIDVLPGAWYFDSVKNAYEKGQMNGVTELCFDPYSPVRRSEAAQVIFNMSGAEKTEFKSLFSDVAVTDWFSDAVLWAVQAGVMAGYEDGQFLPAKYITREELVVSLYKYKNSPEIKEAPADSFYDREHISPEAENAFNWAIAEGILLGDGNNCLNPKANLTRAELATILARV